MAVYIMNSKDYGLTQTHQRLLEEQKNAFLASHYFEMRDSKHKDAKECLRLIHNGDPKAARALYDKITSSTHMNTAPLPPKKQILESYRMDALLTRAMMANGYNTNQIFKYEK